MSQERWSAGQCRAALMAIATAILMLSSAVCFAEDKIGNAIVIKNQVEGVTAAGTQALATGTEVYSNETVRTRSESKAELLFLDNTNLSVDDCGVGRDNNYLSRLLCLYRSRHL